jgi:hypothetical protein
MRPQDAARRACTAPAAAHCTKRGAKSTLICARFLPPASRRQVVKQAEQQILARELAGTENKEYLAMDGLPAFNKATAKLLFGDLPALAEGRVATIQGLSVRRAPQRVCIRAELPALRRAAGCDEGTCGDARHVRCRAGHGLAAPGRRVRGQVPAGPGACWALRCGGGAGADGAAAQIAYISEPTWGNHKNIFGDERVEWRTYRYFDPKTVGLDFDGALLGAPSHAAA